MSIDAYDPRRENLADQCKTKAQMDEDRLEAAIAGISETLSGHGVPQFERICLHEDRKELREQLAALRRARGQG